MTRSSYDIDSLFAIIFSFGLCSKSCKLPGWLTTGSHIGVWEDLCQGRHDPVLSPNLKQDQIFQYYFQQFAYWHSLENHYFSAS